MTLRGTLRYVDLGPGQWVLETSDGQVALFGDIDRALVDHQVTVQGQPVDGHSASMAAERAVMVTSVRSAG